ncbi:AraC family transcriptional regulator [Cohnella sp. AR92]|nr:AraC family transcriptional regulator [Cohnella sp. AR92]RUS47005.1 AraC family transcriptional regulator [Cohnella sp. AR92]
MGEEGQRWEVRAGDMLILHPERSHFPAAPCAEDTLFYWVHFQAGHRWTEVDSESNAPPRDSPNPYEANRRDPAISMHFGSSYQLLLQQYWTFKHRVAVEEGIKHLLSLNHKTAVTNCWDQQEAFQKWLRILYQETRDVYLSDALRLTEKVTEYIRKHYKEAIDSEALANEFHFHPVYLTRCMQRNLGCTPLQYLQKVRIEQAKLLLVNTDHSISAIAGEVGFESNSYFTRCFHRSEHITPRDYRNRFRA